MNAQSVTGSESGGAVYTPDGLPVVTQGSGESNGGYLPPGVLCPIHQPVFGSVASRND